MTTNTYVDGKVWVRRRQCETCIFRPGNLMQLNDGRVEEMINAAVEEQSCIPCHHHLYEGQAIEPVCRGFWDRHKTHPLQVAERLDRIGWIE
jgi:hypothetical protein